MSDGMQDTIRDLELTIRTIDRKNRALIYQRKILLKENKQLKERISLTLQVAENGVDLKCKEIELNEDGTLQKKEG